jgi:hypothetical protein
MDDSWIKLEPFQFSYVFVRGLWGGDAEQQTKSASSAKNIAN